MSEQKPTIYDLGIYRKVKKAGFQRAITEIPKEEAEKLAKMAARAAAAKRAPASTSSAPTQTKELPTVRAVPSETAEPKLKNESDGVDCFQLVDKDPGWAEKSSEMRTKAIDNTRKAQIKLVKPGQSGKKDQVLKERKALNPAIYTLIVFLAEHEFLEAKDVELVLQSIEPWYQKCRVNEIHTRIIYRVLEDEKMLKAFLRHEKHYWSTVLAREKQKEAWEKMYVSGYHPLFCNDWEFSADAVAMVLLLLSAFRKVYPPKKESLLKRLLKLKRRIVFWQ